jgi:hypothetical protein
MSVRHTVPLFLACGLLATGVALAQVPAVAPQAPAGVVAQANSPSVSTQAPIKPGAARVPQAVKAEASPAWSELTPQQQQSLAPLGGSWKKLSAAHKAKWIALSANYPTLPPAEQQLLHSRMGEWAALSPQQRTQARLNFAESSKVAPDDKKAKWEAYQALPPEEKRKLAAGANAAKPPPPPTAPAVRPVPQQKLANIPRSRKDEARIAVVPGQVAPNTLLPQPGLVPLQP